MRVKSAQLCSAERYTDSSEVVFPSTYFYVHFRFAQKKKELMKTQNLKESRRTAKKFFRLKQGEKY